MAKKNPHRLKRGEGGGLALLAQRGRDYYRQIGTLGSKKSAEVRATRPKQPPRFLRKAGLYTPAQCRLLHAAAERYQMSLSSILREALDLWLLDLEQGGRWGMVTRGAPVDWDKRQRTRPAGVPGGPEKPATPPAADENPEKA